MEIRESPVITLTTSVFPVSKLWIILYYIDFGNKVIEFNWILNKLTNKVLCSEVLHDMSLKNQC